MQNNNPIGIFDSGIGGLTIAHALKEAMPHESIVYFGDTAHFPYGDKSPESIEHYSAKIASFLLSKNCKAIVIACNTASSLALDKVKKICKSNIPVFDVIHPVADHFQSNHTGSHIGIIGTKGTISSGIYKRFILQRNDSLRVTSMSTPLLAPMIEEGFTNSPISKAVINEYLSREEFLGINSIVLGCTHYPLIKKEIVDFYEGNIEVIDSANLVVRSISNALDKNNLLNDQATASYEFYLSDYTKEFSKRAKTFFGEEIELKEFRMWD